ncbi:metal-dependent hydrolase [Actinoplanes campanulatus]|nr:metal-dependent hydrolase [Actinoplanes campanulatus]GID41971.1 hypothetical protein Aca09nite_84770 [Actinoplanes campanulatus]
MGRSHALSGGVGWLAGCAALTAAGAAPAPAAVVFGAAIATGMALAPDVDHPKSTIAHSVGHLTRMLAGGVSPGVRRPADRVVRALFGRPDARRAPARRAGRGSGPARPRKPVWCG